MPICSLFGSAYSGGRFNYQDRKFINASKLWSARNIREEPGLFKSITPAWNNQNLKQNTGIIKSNCFFAHIRAASEGIIAENNTHPFHYKKYMMMHNGGIHNFKKIKRDLINLLSDDYYQWINGETYFCTDDAKC